MDQPMFWRKAELHVLKGNAACGNGLHAARRVRLLLRLVQEREDPLRACDSAWREVIT